MKTKLGVLLAAAVITVAHAADEAGFKSIFNGTDLSGWDGNPKFWSVRDGAITGQTTAENPTKGNTFIIWKGGETADFELRLSFKIVGGNSGIQYRSQVADQANWVVGGYQADFEAGTTYSGILYEERGRGILAQRGQMTWIQPDGKIRVVGSLGKSEDIQAVIKKEEWNDYVVIARGNQLTHVINGRVTVHVVDDQADKAARSGVLAFQVHAGPPMTVQFKNIRLKDLGGKQTAAAESRKIDGKWGAKKIVMNGDEISEDQLSAVEMVFENGRYSSSWDGGSDRGTYTISSDASPGHMDLVSENSGRVPAIFEWSGDLLKVCYGFGGVPRPKEFTAPYDSERLVAIYYRKK